MHRIDIPAYITERVIARRGRAHCFEDLTPATTALLVVDMQNGFIVPEHAAAYVPEAAGIVPNINRLAAAMRKAGGKVFWIAHTVMEGTLDNWSNYYAMSPLTREVQERRVDNMRPGAMGHALFSGLDRKADEPVVLKQRFSAFIQGSSNLHEQLTAAGIDTIVVVGTVTNVCCESTARDGMMLNYKTIVVSDANAALTDAEHNASLVGLYSTFADVMDTDYLIGRLGANTVAK